MGRAERPGDELQWFRHRDQQLHRAGRRRLQQRRLSPTSCGGTRTRRAVDLVYQRRSGYVGGERPHAAEQTGNVAQIGDYDGDGKSDILLIDTAGDLAVWLMNGSTVASSVGISNVGPTWQVQNANAN